MEQAEDILFSDEEDYRNILSDGSEEEVDQEEGEVASPVQGNRRRGPTVDRTERFKQVPHPAAFKYVPSNGKHPLLLFDG